MGTIDAVHSEGRVDPKCRLRKTLNNVASVARVEIDQSKYGPIFNWIQFELYLDSTCIKWY